MFRSVRQYARRFPQEIAEQREFDRLFNGDDVVELCTENSSTAPPRTRRFVLSCRYQIQLCFWKPSSGNAPMVSVRVAGTVRFSGTEGSSSTAGYTVDFSEGDQARLLDLAVGVVSSYQEETPFP